MDEKVNLGLQLQQDVGPVVLIKEINVNPEDIGQFLKAWTADASIFKQQPGYISAQLHSDIAGCGTFINYAMWASMVMYKKAASNVDIQTRLSNYPAGPVASPHFFKKVAGNLCRLNPLRR